MLQFLWGLINTIQMVMVTALFAILIPLNAFTLMITLLKLSNLDIMRTEDIHRSLFGFSDQVPFNAVYEQAGYETTNFLIESGTLLFVIVAFALFTALKAILNYATQNCGENCLTKRLRQRSSLNVPIVRFLLEGCMDLGLVSAICLLGLDNNFSPNHAIAIVLLVALLVTPLYLLRAAHKFKKSQAKELDEVETRKVITRYAKLFANLWPKRIASLLFNMVFMLRRFFVILILTLLMGHPNLQVWFYLLCSSLSL